MPATGISADLHESQIQPDGTAWLVGYKAVETDLTPYGGPADGRLVHTVAQRVDIATGEVLFQWDPIDHVSPMESMDYIGSGAVWEPAWAKLWDPYHINSIEITPTGDLMISARNTWTVYLVNGTTGDVIWRLGGRQSDFLLGPGVSFAWQHDARLLSDGTISLFDNSGDPRVSTFSRGLVIKLDTATHRATLVKQYAHAGIAAGAEGSTRVLPNGNVLVGWGWANTPGFTEFTADGDVVLDARFTTGYENYRAFKLPWVGRPTSLPKVAVKTVRGKAKVCVSRNGATEVAEWRVLGGSSRMNVEPLETAAKRGFETEISVRLAAFYRVEALDATGNVLGTSATVKRNH